MEFATNYSFIVFYSYYLTFVYNIVVSSYSFTPIYNMFHNNVLKYWYNMVRPMLSKVYNFYFFFKIKIFIISNYYLDIILCELSIQKYLYNIYIYEYQSSIVWMVLLGGLCLFYFDQILSLNLFVTIYE